MSDWRKMSSVRNENKNCKICSSSEKDVLIMTMGSSNKEWNQQPENLNIKLSFVSFLPKPWCSTYRMLRPQRVKWWFWSAGSEEALLHRSGGTEKETRSWTPLTFGYYRKVSAAFCRLECFSCGCNYLLRDIFLSSPSRPAMHQSLDQLLSQVCFCFYTIHISVYCQTT